MGKALSILKNEMVGSYCFTFISDDNSVYAARDPKGFRPMVLGHKESDDTYIVTSESAAVTAVAATLQRDVVPGELIKLSKNGLETELVLRLIRLVHIVHLNLLTLHIHQV